MATKVSASWAWVTRLGFLGPAVAVAVYAALDGLVFHQISVGGPDTTRRVIDTLRAMLIAVRDATKD
jgi:hypothetical protein